MQPFQYPLPDIRIETAELTDLVRFKLSPGSALVGLTTSAISSLPTNLQERVNQLRELQPENKSLLIHTASSKPAVVLHCTLEEELSPFEKLTHARKTLAQLNDYAVDELVIYLAHPDEAWLDAFVSAHLAYRAEPPSYKSDEKPRHLPTKLVLAAKKPLKLNVDRLLCEAQGNALARHLALTPASELTPEIYRAYALKLALEHQWQTDWFSQERLRDMGAGAFLAVIQGSPDESGGILKLSYRPEGTATELAEQEAAEPEAAEAADVDGAESVAEETSEQGDDNEAEAIVTPKLPTLALVGKGLCFDTGGYNVKTGSFMYGMHLDMGGSAVALGTLLALSLAKVPFAVDCYLALAENHIGPESYKPNDLVTALNGTTIEVVNTDAEGRMVLADTLTLASEEQPDLLIDYATLTGSCVRAIGTSYSGAFTNRPDWHAPLIALGQQSGERIWPFPLDKDFDNNIKSKTADVLQCAPGASTDHIDAARFLSRFVTHDTPWLHIDLSAFKTKGGLAHVPGEVSGFGVRLTLEALLGDKPLLEL